MEDIWERRNDLKVMKSFCIKTNNEDILDYLLSRTKEIDFEDLTYCKKKFKIYQNVVIHYQDRKSVV